MTTAAGMGGTAAIGMAVGAGMYWLGLFEGAAVLVAIQIISSPLPVGADAPHDTGNLVELEDTDELGPALTICWKQHRGQTESSLTPSGRLPSYGDHRPA